MSGQPRGQLWVDPDGVVHLGDSYAEHGALYEGYVTQLEQLRNRYGKSWGDDDMGQAFSQRFLQGLDALDGIVGSVKGTLNYTAEGLRQSGKLYRDANEQAGEMSHQLAGNFDELPQGVFQRRQATVAPQQEQPQLRRAVVSRGRTLGDDEAEAPRYERAMVTRGRTLEPGERRVPPPEGELRRTEAQMVVKSVHPDEVEGQPRFRRSVHPGELSGFESTQAIREPMARVRGRLVGEESGDPLVQRALTREELEQLPEAQFMPAERVYQGLEPTQGVRGALLPEVGPGETAGELRRAMPAISAYSQQGGWQDARIDGVPLAEGYQLRGLSTFEDGTTRIDANLYQSISPVTPGHTVTDANGQPITAAGGPLFVVKENPSVDPTAPGYEPFIVSFTPDGTAVPIVTDF